MTIADTSAEASAARDGTPLFPQLQREAPERPAGPTLRAIRRSGWELRLALLVAIAAALGAQLAATYAAFDQLDPLPTALGAGLALVGLAVGLVHIARLTRERRQSALIETLAETFSTPRDVAGAADSAARRLVDLGLADACLVAVAREQEEGETAITPLAAAGYPGGWLAEAEPRMLAVPKALPRAEREDGARDRWLTPVASAFGEQLWVARVPIVRGDAVLGLVLLAAHRRGSLREAPLLEAVGAQLAGALDFASLYEAAYEHAARLEQQDSRRREFLYAIAHELRSPLTSIQTFAELLAREQQTLDGASEMLLSSLSRGVDRLGAFVDDLLELGRVEETEVRLQLTDVDVASTLRSAEAMLRPSFMEREQALAIELPEEALVAHADARALEQVLLNLLSNANRFTPEEGAVAVRALRHEDRVRVEVEDSGPGIAPEDRALIFQPFFRVQREDAAQVPGSGLGLAVARRLTELQGGRIWVEDATGRGSRFCLELATLEGQPAPSEPKPLSVR